MKERPIIMTGESVRAILAGRKSQTRRLITPQPIYGAVLSTRAWMYALPDGASPAGPLRCPYGAPGDRLWVREAWRVEARELERGSLTHMIDYQADPGTPKLTRTNHLDAARYAGLPWRSPMFMPRWASRLTLEVTAVRVERLQAITEADAIAEGVTLPERTATHYDGIHRDAYAALWDRINSKRAPWVSNPWVWVVEFRRAEP